MWSEWESSEKKAVGPGLWFSVRAGTTLRIEWRDQDLTHLFPRTSIEEFPIDGDGGLVVVSPIKENYFRWRIDEATTNHFVLPFIEGVTKDGQPLDYVLSVDPDKDEAIIAETYWLPIEKRGQPIPDPDGPYGYKTITVKGNIQKSQTATKPYSSSTSASGGVYGGTSPKCDMCGQYHPGYMDCYMC